MTIQKSRRFNWFTNSLAALGLGYLSTVGLYLLTFLLLFAGAALHLHVDNDPLVGSVLFLFEALKFSTGNGNHVVAGVAFDSVLLGMPWLLVLWLLSRRKSRHLVPSAKETAELFNWRTNSVVSFCVGLAITIGIAGAAGTSYVDLLSWPGFLLAAPFGGVHGGAGAATIFVSTILGSTVFYAAVSLLVLWGWFKWRARRRITSKTDSGSVIQLHL